MLAWGEHLDEFQFCSVNTEELGLRMFFLGGGQISEWAGSITEAGQDQSLPEICGH